MDSISDLQSINATQWYAIAFSGIVVVLFVLRGFGRLFQMIYAFASLFFLKNLSYPQCHIYPKLFGRTTGIEALLIVTVITANVTCLWVRPTSTLMNRAGLLSSINLIFLCLGGNVSFIPRSCGFPHEGYSRAHRWIGRIAVVEGLLHSIMAVVLRPSGYRVVPAWLVRQAFSSTWASE
jgi:hypothetical protein